jgi:CRP-like cAMP-binding protein
VDGNVRIERRGKVLTRRGAGAFIGELALLDGEPRTATVVAETPCTLLVINGTQFWQLLDAVPSVQRKMLVGLARRLRETQERHDSQG